MAISVIDPITPALARMKLVCFQPFDIGKWFTLGFCAFLATCDQQGGQGANFNAGGGRGGPGGGNPVGDALRWIESNAALAAAIVAGVLVLIVAIEAVTAWLGARGKFMFLDGVVHNRGAVVKPWNDYAHLADSFFKLRFGLMLLGMAVVAVPIAVWLAMAWGEIKQGSVQTPTVIAAVLMGALVLFAVLALAAINWVLVTLVIPIMYQFDVGVGEAIRIFRRDVMAGNVGAIILLFLMQIVLGLAVGIAMLFVMCATCCIAALPYLSCVVFLPVFVFFQCYDLYFIQQFGPAFRIFDAAGVCSVCGYDLRGSVGRTQCPECGAPISEPDTGYQPPAAPPTSP